MENPVCVIMTSSNCGACVALHSSGNFNREGKINNKISMGGFQWDAISFCKLICGSETLTDIKIKYTVYEYELYLMNDASNTGVKSFTIFTYIPLKRGGFVKRNTYHRNIQSGDGILHIIDKGKATGIQGSFNELVSKVFPAKLYSYAVQFPVVLYCGVQEWKSSVENKNISPYVQISTLKVGMGMDRKNPTNAIWTAIEQDRENLPYKKNYITFGIHILNNIHLLNPPKLENSLINQTNVPNHLQEEKNVIVVQPKKIIRFLKTKTYGMKY